MYVSHLFTDEHKGRFHLLTIVNHAAVNIYTQVSEVLFSILWGMESGIVRSYNNSMVNVLKNPQIIFYFILFHVIVNEIVFTILLDI